MLFLLPLLLHQAGNPQPVTSLKGMVVCDEPIAARIGAKMLERGANAVDAAVAVAFALSVVQPTAGNIGGGGFMLVRMANGRTEFLDYRETAPATAHRTMYAANPKESTEGLRAAGVPGTVAGMGEAMRRFGTMKWKDVVEPSVRLARTGFPISATQSQALQSSSKRLSNFALTQRIYLRNGKHYSPGEQVKLPELGSTLARIRDKGWQEFYTGQTARLIAHDMRERGGHITTRDLATYRVIVRKPLIGSYRGHQIITAPPPSSGGVALIEMLNMLEPFEPKEYPYGSAKRYHLLIEAMKLAFADRSELLGDPDHVQVPVAELISKEYSARQRLRINLVRATPSASIRPGLGAPESEQTTHFSVVDQFGNVVSNTYTLNGGFGSGDIAEGTGILMNNEMDDFASNPGKPNMYGLIQGERNAIVANKRPLSSMTPTIVLSEGKPLLVVGSPGGPTIINTVLQVILNCVDHKMSIGQAVQAPRIHHQWMPDTTYYEGSWLSSDTLAALSGMGHKVSSRAAQGTANCIEIDLATGVRRGMPDKRYADAAAAGG